MYEGFKHLNCEDVMHVLSLFKERVSDEHLGFDEVLEDASPTKDEINKDNILPKPSEENLQLEPRGDEETDIQEKEQKESQKQTNPSTGRKGPSQVEV
ncbi:hypothetical protein Tco_0870645 [Tanacetum coccineum]